jgi:hypothetical protein
MPVNLTIPPLDNGLIAQLPVELEIRRSAPENRFADGTVMAAASEARSVYRWRLSLEHLNAAEWARYETFLALTKNGIAPFRFLDPLGNLLSHTSDLSAPVWLIPPGLTVAPFEDPEFSNAFILTNGTGQSLSMQQSVSMHAVYLGCFSVWAKWAGGAVFSLEQSSGAAFASVSAVAGEWSRHSACLRAESAGTSRMVSIVVPGNTQLIVAHPQLETAASAGPYVPTGGASGIHEARLRQSAINLRSSAPGANSIQLLVESTR